MGFITAGPTKAGKPLGAQATIEDSTTAPHLGAGTGAEAAPQPDLGTSRTASVVAVATAALQIPVTTWTSTAPAMGMKKLITLPGMVDSPKRLTWSLEEIKLFY